MNSVNDRENAVTPLFNKRSCVVIVGAGFGGIYAAKALEEEAEMEQDPERLQPLLTFVLIGAGPTGVEMAGAIAELAHVALNCSSRDAGRGICSFGHHG